MSEAAVKPRQSAWDKHPGYRIDFVACPRRVRCVLAGETVADSTAAVYLLETAHTPVYYFPQADVRMDLLHRTDHSTFCPFKGDASYWSISAAGGVVENAVWTYATPFPEAAHMQGFVAFYWDRMDAWYEEDEEIFVHPRDPHVRVDALRSSRQVSVEIGGECVARSERCVFLFETGLPVRHYFPREDVRTELLTPSQTVSRCPYKGEAHYWSAEAGGHTVADAAWAYAQPLAECMAIEDHICFFGERVDTVTVDGEVVPRPRTRWSTD